MLNQLGLEPVRHRQRETRTAPILLGPEFHAGMRVWRLLVDGGVGSPERTMTTPPVCFFAQPYSCLLWSNASGNARGGYFLRPGLRSGVWWRLDFSPEVRGRVQEQVYSHDDLSINTLEFLQWW